MGKPCFCKPGMMAQCTADGHNEQITCRFYNRASEEEKCLHFNSGMNDHCWSPDAYHYAKHGDPTEEREDELEISLDKLLENTESDASGFEDEDGNIMPLSVDGTTCEDCKNFACNALLRIAQNYPNGMTTQDLAHVRQNCGAFVLVSKIKRGGQP